MQMQRNNLAWSNGLNVGLAIVGFNPVMGRFVDAAGAARFPDIPDFIIAAEAPYTAWPVVAASPDRFAVVYCAGDNAANPRRIRFVTPTVTAPPISGLGPVSAFRELVNLAEEPIWSERSPVAWHETSQSFLVSSRVPSGMPGCPKAILQRVMLDGTVSEPLDLSDATDYRSPRAIVETRHGTAKVVGWQAGIPQAYAGGTWHREVGVLAWRALTTLLVIPGRHEDQCAAGELIGWAENGAVQIDDGLVRLHYFGPDAGDIALSDVHPDTGTALLLSKGPGARLQATEILPNGQPARPNDVLVLEYWDGLVKDWMPSVCCVPGGWLVGFGWSRLRKVNAFAGRSLRSVNVEPPAPPVVVDPPPAEPTVPALVPANRPLWVGEWDVSSENWPHVNGCDGSASTTAPSGAQDCACGSLAKGPGYGYHDAPGNFEYLGRWADLAKRRQPDRDFVAHPAITATQRTTAAAGPTDGPVTARGRCVGIAVHLGATDEDETLLAAPRREADHLGVPVWLYCDRGLWTDRQLQLLRPGDVAVRQAYRGADNPRDGTREEFKASIRQAETTGHAIALVRRNFRGAGMNVALGDILESHEDLSQLVAEHPRIIADTSFCRAPAARGGPLMYPVLDRVMAKIAEGSTGTPSLTPVAPRLLTLLASPTTGPAPLEVAFTVHEPATGAAFDPASVEFWTSRAGAPLHRHTPKPGHLNLLELREPGHWLVEARVHSSVGRTSDRVAITVAPPPTRKTAKDKSAVYAGVAAAAVAFFSLFRKKKKDTKEPQ